MTKKIFAERSITITRHFKAPRDLVWQVWTDPKHIKEWFGPEHFTNPLVEGETKVGSIMHITMHGPAGTDFDRDLPCTLLFREVVPGSKLVFENEPVAPDGSRIMEALTTVTFTDENGGTRMVMESTAKALVEYTVGYLNGMEQGWSGSFEKMKRLLEK
jgi:uncharacterized protein YndB with AHSA1/START domain